jgi:hypothetical protein
MGWFSRNRRPFSKAFLERLDRIEAAVESLVEPETVFEVPAPEVIPAEIISSRTVGGVEEFAWREVTTEPNDTGGRASDGFDAAGAADAYAFAAKNPAEGQTFVIKHWVSTTDGANPIHEVKHTVVGGAVVGTFDARITGRIQIEDDARWEYEWVESVWNDTTKRFEDLQNGRTHLDITKAINRWEDANTDVLGYGIELAPDQGLFFIHDTDQQFEFLPVPNNTIISISVRTDKDGEPVAVFEAPNPIDGACAP